MKNQILRNMRNQIIGSIIGVLVTTALSVYFVFGLHVPELLFNMVNEDKRTANLRAAAATQQVAVAKRKLANIAHSLREHLTDPGLFSER